jgi:oxalate decarboxylase/phosphoglucose isomerase-like protein (cupin superfamily)
MRIIMIECNCGCTFNESDNTFDFILIICPDCAQEYETDNDAPCAGELEYESQCYD